MIPSIFSGGSSRGELPTETGGFFTPRSQNKQLEKLLQLLRDTAFVGGDLGTLLRLLADLGRGGRNDRFRSPGGRGGGGGGGRGGEGGGGGGGEGVCFDEQGRRVPCDLP